MSVINITAANFEQEVLNSEKPVLLDFWAEWCGPCKRMAPVFHEAAEEAADVKFGKVDIMASPELAEKYGVMSIPTLMLFENGKPANTVVGAVKKEVILQMAGK